MIVLDARIVSRRFWYLEMVRQQYWWWQAMTGGRGSRQVAKPTPVCIRLRADVQHERREEHRGRCSGLWDGRVVCSVEAHVDGNDGDLPSDQEELQRARLETIVQARGGSPKFVARRSPDSTERDLRT